MAFLTRSALWLSLLCIPTGAMALEQVNTPNKQDDASQPQTAVGVVCDTPEQLQQYLKLHIAGAEPAVAIERVNTEARNPTACGVIASAFVETRKISEVSISSGILRVVQITILATRNAMGWHRVPPTVQYTALFVKAQEV